MSVIQQLTSYRKECNTLWTHFISRNVHIIHSNGKLIIGVIGLLLHGLKLANDSFQCDKNLAESYPNTSGQQLAAVRRTGTD